MTGKNEDRPGKATARNEPDDEHYPDSHWVRQVMENFRRANGKEQSGEDHTKRPLIILK